MSAVYESEDPDSDARVTLVSNSFQGIPEWCCGGDESDSSEKALYIEYAGASEEAGLIWVHAPKHFTRASTYANYGNAPSTNNSYVSGALIIDFPAANNGIRAPNAII